jgi:type I restriction enzyme S subunit
MDLLPTTGIYAARSETRSFDQLTSGTYVEDGDVMIAKITPCFENGKQGILAVDSPFAYATTEVIPLRGRPTKTDSLFLHFLLLHPGLRAKLASQMEGSTNRQRLPKEVVEKASVPVPPLAEQRQIAAVLSAVQRAIDRQERLIALAAELKKALTHKLFTEGCPS